MDKITEQSLHKRLSQFQRELNLRTRREVVLAVIDIHNAQKGHGPSAVKEIWITIGFLQEVLKHSPITRYIAVKKVVYSEIVDLINKYRRIQDTIDQSIIEEGNFFVVLRKLTKIQLKFQTNINLACLSRQHVIFKDNPFGVDLFGKAARMTIDDFILAGIGFKYVDMYLSTAWGKSQDYNITTYMDQQMTWLSQMMGDNLAARIFNLLSLNIEESSQVDDFNDYASRIKNPLFAGVNLVRQNAKPFMVIDGMLFELSAKLRENTFRELSYHLPKHLHGQAFISWFTEAFEEYVDKVLQYSKIMYINETAIKTLIAKPSKVCDFLVEDSILIEAKGVDINLMAVSNPRSEAFENLHKTTVAKAIQEQLPECSRSLANVGVIVKFFIVVTYIDFSISISDNLISYLIDKSPEENQGVLDAAHTFVMPVDELEHLVFMAMHNNKSIQDLLEYAVEKQKETSVHSVIDHLKEIYPISDNPPSFHGDVIAQYTELIRSRAAERS